MRNRIPTAWKGRKGTRVYRTQNPDGTTTLELQAWSRKTREFFTVARALQLANGRITGVLDFIPKQGPKSERTREGVLYPSAGGPEDKSHEGYKNWAQKRRARRKQFAKRVLGVDKPREVSDPMMRKHERAMQRRAEDIGFQARMSFFDDTSLEHTNAPLAAFAARAHDENGGVSIRPVWNPITGSLDNDDLYDGIAPPDVALFRRSAGEVGIHPIFAEQPRHI